MSNEKRKYVGARYVPLFSEPLEWSNTRTYEPLTIVLNEGNSYTSRQFVPTGIDISNESYWALTGNYNAQVEQYRQEVQALDGRITQNATDIANVETTIAAPEEEGLEGLKTQSIYGNGGCTVLYMPNWTIKVTSTSANSFYKYEDEPNALNTEVYMKA